MAKIIEILDSDLEGYKARLNDGRIVHVPFGQLETLNIGDEFDDPQPAPAAPARSGVKIAHIVDVNASGHTVRLDDGRTVVISHSAGQSVQVGDEYIEPTVCEESNAPCVGCADKDQQIDELTALVSARDAEIERLTEQMAQREELFTQDANLCRNEISALKAKLGQVGEAINTSQETANAVDPERQPEPKQESLDAESEETLD